MTRAGTLTVFCVIAALGVAVMPADAGQRRGQRDGQGGQRAAQPRDDGRGDRRGAPPVRVGSGRRAGPGVVFAPHVFAPNVFSPHVFGPVGRRGLARGYDFGYGYGFRPRLNVGLGVWTGFAGPFPHGGFAGTSPFGYPMAAYGYPAPYPVPYAVPYAVPGAYPSPSPMPHPARRVPPSGGDAAAVPQGSVSVTPMPPGSFGGVSLEITPADAEVWVDGAFAGRSGDFAPASQPLTLATGRHRLEIRAPGYLSLSIDVMVTPGYVVPFQGVLQPGP